MRYEKVSEISASDFAKVIAIMEEQAIKDGLEIRSFQYSSLPNHIGNALTGGYNRISLAKEGDTHIMKMRVFISHWPKVAILEDIEDENGGQLIIPY